MWAMVGSSTFRRGGLTFYGGANLVWTDLSLTDGSSTAIASFRWALQADRQAPRLPPCLPSCRRRRVFDSATAWKYSTRSAIRETLRAGGLGRIARLAPAERVGRPASPDPIDVVSPDVEALNMLRLPTHLLLVNAASA